jgi:hypothetical protein
MELKEFAKSADGALRIITTLWKMKQSRKRGKEMGNNCNCKHNHNSNSDEPCCGCDSRQTNADRIRDMSDEELADTLFNSCLEVMHIDECPYVDNVGMCKKCILEWLQSEAE